MKKAKTLEEYRNKRHFGLKTVYIWKWSKNQTTPDNWLTARPIKFFGKCLGYRVEVVKKGYEHFYFTHTQ